MLLGVSFFYGCGNTSYGPLLVTIDLLKLMQTGHWYIHSYLVYGKGKREYIFPVIFMEENGCFG
jgi:hypothetical protein